MPTATNTILQEIGSKGTRRFRYVPDGTTCQTRTGFLSQSEVDTLLALPDLGSTDYWEAQNCLLATGTDIISDVEPDISNYPPDGVVLDEIVSGGDPGDLANIVAVQFYTTP